MPVDTDSFSSSFLGNMKSSFTMDEIASPSQLNASIDRKRKYFEDESQDISSVRSTALRYVYQDVEPDDSHDFLQTSTGNRSLTSQDLVDKTVDQQKPSLHSFYSFASENDRQNSAAPEKQVTRLSDESRAVPNEIGTRAVPSETSSRAVPNEIQDREVLDSILSNLPSRGTMDERDLGAAAVEQDSSREGSSAVLLPMKNLVEKLAQEMKNRTVKDWTDVFSNMESFETTKLEQLDQILKAALAYEAKLKSEKAELRNFLIKLSDVLNHD